ncbi:MAG: Gfo/Idh/MocA family oxidoreductase [Chloroflexi bacterium]|nr:Gfo/Idh/MocA family oxidoreductase [Chloroflexota bacterium]
MKQVVSTSTGVQLLEIPRPALEPGTVAVEVAHSFVSSGTEMATVNAVESQGGSLAGHVARNPQLISRVVDHLKKRGIRKTVSSITSHLSTRSDQSQRLVALGYSCAGKVIGVGPGVTTTSVGDRVACAGASRATHSEIVVVPENLITHIPPGLDTRNASSVAVGAIALQAVRQADLRLGESAAVIGLGLIGLMTTQLLKAAGIRVIGFELDEKRNAVARELGIDEAHSEIVSAIQATNRFTGHHGVDATILTASSRSPEVANLAMELTRKKGKVVVVGDVKLDLARNPFLRKEIELVVSSSYGPGRYDESYEDGGHDYPYAYVRWTEQRNMEAYLRLVRDGSVTLEPLVRDFELALATSAYAALQATENRPIAAILSYPVGDGSSSIVAPSIIPTLSRSVPNIALVGAGKFVMGTHVPILRGLSDKAHIAAIVGRSGARAAEAAAKLGAEIASTDIDEVLGNDDIDAIIIGTRHNLHASLVLQALNAGKHVLVEKPLAVNPDELSEIESFYGSDDPVSKPILLTGFNRRFAPLVLRLREWLSELEPPYLINYQMNAGFMDPAHWLRTEEGAGRNIGEACHIYDVLTSITEARATSVSAKGLRWPGDVHARNENFTTTIEFEDGSMGAATYSSVGSSKYPKELLHVHAGEHVFVLTDYLNLESHGVQTRTESIDSQDKGHKNEIEAFIEAISGRADVPIPLWQQFQATRIANEVETLLRSPIGA